MNMGNIIALIKSLGGGGGGSVPKPLTYDYMPEGYPKKTVQSVTLMEEQEVAFANRGGKYAAVSPVQLELSEGSAYTVVWDGVEYNCVCYAINSDPYIGNPAAFGLEATGEPFFYVLAEGGLWVSYDSAENHTISVVGPTIEYKEIDKNFIPKLYMGKTNPAGDGTFSLNRKADTLIGEFSFAEGYNTTAAGANSHAEGNNTAAYGTNSHAEGYNTTAYVESSHAEGDSTTASDACSHAEGDSTTASGANSHAEGDSTTASGANSHAEGFSTTASGNSSHSEGRCTKASSQYQHVQGKYNIEDTANIYADIVGNGTSDTKMSNAYTLDWSGNGWFAGTVESDAIILRSSTADSTKKFKITVDDTGTLSVTEVT